VDASHIPLARITRESVPPQRTCVVDRDDTSVESRGGAALDVCSCYGRIYVPLTVAFGAASRAIGSAVDVGLRPNLPAAALPTVQLTTAQQTALSDAIGPQQAARFGIATASFSQTREVLNTSLGYLYLVPGANGACLVLTNVSSCGDPGTAGEPILALAVSRDSSDFIGGGIAAVGVGSINVTGTHGATSTVSVRRGVFGVDAPTNGVANGISMSASPTSVR